MVKTRQSIGISAYYLGISWPYRWQLVRLAGYSCPIALRFLPIDRVVPRILLPLRLSHRRQYNMDIMGLAPFMAIDDFKMEMIPFNFHFPKLLGWHSCFVYEPKGNFLHQGQWSSSTTILGAMLYQEIAAGVVDAFNVDCESFKDNCHTFEESTSIENKQNMHKYHTYPQLKLL